MAQNKLTEGCLATIMTGGNVEEPVVQVLGNRKLLGSADKERYRLLLSDGKYKISFAMLATQIHGKIISGELSTFSIIKVKKYITSMINNSGKGDRRIMVVLELDILASGEEIGQQIGNPTQLPDDPDAMKATTSNGNASTSTSTVTTKPAAFQPKKPVASAVDLNASDFSNLTVPIDSLTPYNNKWVIKATVTNKSAVRTWSNSRGEGKLFSVDFADESGEIRATVFRDLVDKFYDLIEIGKVYYISKCQIKVANKKFSTIDNEYEMTFHTETTVTPCLDEQPMAVSIYNFQSLDKISGLEVGSIIDVIGICKNVSEVQTIHAKSTNRELRKREVTLLDQSNNSITLTLWGNDAETFDGTSEPVLAIRGAKVGEFGGGKNLSVLINSAMQINPDLPEAHQLRGWYDNSGKNQESVNLSARAGGSMQSEWLSIDQVKKRQGGDNVLYYQCKATTLLVNSTNALYQACPQADCNKKLVDLQNGQYRCEKCNREFDNFKYRLIMSMNVADWSDNQWLSMFAGEAEKVLGITSQQLGERTETDTDALSTVCNNANFTEYIFKCRAKVETYNDESRLKCVALRVDSIDHNDYDSYLIASIKKIAGL